MAVYAGAHGHLEQPRGALSWLDPDVKHWNLAHGHHFIAVAACSHEVMIEKVWLFSASYPPLASIAALCNHTFKHESIAGVKDHLGQYLSRQSAEYPPSLCDQIATIISPLLKIFQKLLQLLK